MKGASRVGSTVEMGTVPAAQSAIRASGSEPKRGDQPSTHAEANDPTRIEEEKEPLASQVSKSFIRTGCFANAPSKE